MAVKIGMVSLGCAKNQVDAELMLGTLKNAGYELVAEAGMADVAVVNTCGFIESAKQEAIEEILELAKLKKEGKIRAIVVTGCLAERYQREVLDELPEVDEVIGIGADGSIDRVVAEVLKGRQVAEFPPKEQLPLCGERVQTTPYYYSYLKIAEGCDNRCSYCAIPLIRGGFRSRPLEELAEELRLNRADPAAARDSLLQTMACKSAIKAGMWSDPSELQALADKVQSGEIRYCPHGRPVAVKLSKYEMEKMFKRA